MPFARQFVAALALFAVSMCSWPAAAYTSFTPESLLASFFPGHSVQTVAWTPSDPEREQFKLKVGYLPPKSTYIWYVDERDGSPQGYALIDEQVGLHEPITFGVQLNPDATIGRIEVMVYREAYGDGIKSEIFRGQFVGAGYANPMRPGKEIQIVSGATVSTRSLAVGARRASALLATWLGQ